MTAQSSRGETRSSIMVLFDRLPGAQSFKNLSIARKLTIGFGVLVLLTFLGAGVSYLGSYQATSKINTTDDVRVPTALVASRAQANLLRMLADVRGYLALDDPEYRERYRQSVQAFEANLTELDECSPDLDSRNQRRLQELGTAYEGWSDLPEYLFELRNDRLGREPAYRLLVTEGTQFAGRVLIDINQMIELQGQREPTEENLALLQDMAKFQGDFASSLSALRSHVTTHNRIFKEEYAANLTDNQNAWDRLSSKRGALTPSQQALLDNIAQNREAFLLLPEQMFDVLESDRWREDLYLFKTEAVPLAENMQQLLSEMTDDQQTLLKTELASGRLDLANANRLTLASGIVAFIVGLVLASVFYATIAGPVHRLTAVAEVISSGDLEAQARVESRDEIGVLAETFNNMTARLRQTLAQVEQRVEERTRELQENILLLQQEISERVRAESQRDAALEALRAAHDELEIKIQERTAELVKANEALQAEISERVQMEEALRQAHQELAAKAAALEAANAELSQYAYVVSHDVRAPLRAIRNYADFIREDLEGILDKELKLYLDGLSSAVREADELVRDLLQLSRVGQKSVSIEAVDVGAFLWKLIAILSPPKDVEITMADNWPTIEVEPVLLAQIFQNLISNAVKFNRSPQKRVELGWRLVDDSFYELFVRDNGIGIDPRYHEQIFRVFERLHTSEEYEGTGIGLAIVRKAASRLRGSIRLESKPGEGSTFFVALPRKMELEEVQG